jgi:hypothetical protein
MLRILCTGARARKNCDSNKTNAIVSIEYDIESVTLSLIPGFSSGLPNADTEVN